MPEPAKLFSSAQPLPQLLTPFVGREAELRTIRSRLLDPACRMLTLVGPGGIGKTRLALQAAAGLAENLAHGVHFIPLQPVRSEDSLIPAMVDALKVHFADQPEPWPQLLAYLRDKEMLLLLDSFEHLLAEASLLTDLLQLAPAVKLLIASREAVNLAEEWLCPVDGMPYPTGFDPEPAAFGAVQLFASYARRIRPDFSVADEQEAIVRICRLVEGSPLALELAAAWVNTLSCAEIAAEIERSLDFLTSRRRDTPEKHRSVRAVFNQSWALLSPAEQAVFKRLAVFRGGFRRQAAEEVAGASLVSLSALVDKSLLHWEPDGRYQIHELLHQYAAEQLAHSPPEVTAVYDRHSRYYAAFLAGQGRAFRAGRQREALLEIERELENLRAAWQWMVDQLKIEEIEKSVEPLGLFYDFRGRYLEGVRAFEAARRRLEELQETGPVALALAWLAAQLGGLYIRLGRLEEAEAALADCQALYRRLDTPPLPGFGTDPEAMLGIVALIKGDYQKAARLGEQARRTSEQHPNLFNQQLACYVLGRAALLQGQPAQAQPFIQQAYALSRQIGDRWFMAYCLNELGAIAGAEGHYEVARQHYTTSYDLRQEFDDPEGMAVALNHLGEIAIKQADYGEARRLFRQSLAIAREINNQGGIVAALNGLGQAALAAGDYSTARQHFSAGLRIAQKAGFVSLSLSLLAGAGALLLQTGPAGPGRQLLALVERHPGSEPETRERARQGLGRAPVEPPPAHWSDLDAVTAELVLLLETAGQEPGRTAPTAPPPAGLVEPLTEREAEVLQLLAEGLSNPEIAGRLILATGTVKHYTSVIYGKLGVRSRLQAVARARELGLL